MFGLFRRKAKCKQFYKLETSTVDVKGLQASLPAKFNLGLGSFTIDKKYAHATEKLQMLDMLQYSQCQEINLVSNKKVKDNLILENSKARREMMQIVIELSKNAPGTPIPDAFLFATPENLSFEQVATAIAKADNSVIDISGFSPAQRSIVLPGVELKTTSAKGALENIRYLSSGLPDYSVSHENGVYKLEIKPA